MISYSDAFGKTGEKYRKKKKKSKCKYNVILHNMMAPIAYYLRDRDGLSRFAVRININKWTNRRKKKKKTHNDLYYSEYLVVLFSFFFFLLTNTIFIGYAKRNVEMCSMNNWRFNRPRDYWRVCSYVHLYTLVILVKFSKRVGHRRVKNITSTAHTYAW